MKNVLIISGHTDSNESVANKTILEHVAQLMPQAEIVRLDILYPDFKIDVEVEQARLIKADVIVFQFPMFWYSMPSLLHRYVEQTFAHGFSHGRTGDKLKGKKLLLSFTSGAPEDMYRYDGLQNYPIDDFMPPFKQMCNLCQLAGKGYVYSGGLSYAMRGDAAMLQAMKEKSQQHAERLVDKIKDIV